MKRILFVVLLCLPTFIFGQPTDYQVLDKIIAVVGDEIILHSDLMTQKAQALSAGVANSPELECSILENLLFENLLLHQSKLDSIEVSESQIQSELDRRIAVFSQQMGGEDKLIEFYDKSIIEIKLEFYDLIKDQLLIQTQQGSITSEFNLTPADVTDYFDAFNKDSLPYVNAEVEVSQIMIKPQWSTSEIKRVKDKLNEFRTSVLDGSKEFSTLAVLYSEDPGSAAKGGELGVVGKGVMVPEFEAVAYNLAEGDISQVFESDFGYHLMQMIKREGETYNVRHILLIPKVLQEDLDIAKDSLLTIIDMVKTDTISFEKAALMYSEDEGTKHNNGLMINPSTGSIRFEMNEIDPAIFFVIDKLKVGEISDPVLVRGNAGKEAYRIMKLRYRSEPHKANLRDDYQLIQSMAENALSGDVVSEWITERRMNTYVHIDADYQNCTFGNQWIKMP